MTSGIIFEQRRIILANVNFSDGSEIKKRPVVVISNDTFNNKGQDVICCPLTTKCSGKGIKISNSEMEEGKLPEDSEIKSQYPFFLRKNQFSADIGKVKVAISKQIITDIKELIMVPEQNKTLSQ